MSMSNCRNRKRNEWFQYQVSLNYNDYNLREIVKRLTSTVSYREINKRMVLCSSESALQIANLN